MHHSAPFLFSTAWQVGQAIYQAYEMYISQDERIRVDAQSQDWDSGSLVRGSRLTECPKLEARVRLSNAPPRPIELHARLKMEAGTRIASSVYEAIEWARQKNLMDSSLGFQYEVRATRDEVAATTDILVCVDKWLFPVEIKYTDLLDPSAGHLMQMCAQLYVCRADYGVLLMLRDRPPAISPYIISILNSEITAVWGKKHKQLPLSAFWDAVALQKKYFANPKARPPFKTPAERLCIKTERGGDKSYIICPLFKECWE